MTTSISSQMNFKVGDKCCALSWHPTTGKPLWIVGMIRDVVQGGIAYVVAVRKDFKEQIRPFDSAVTLPNLTFTDWTAAAKAVDDIDHVLNHTIAAYDGNWDWDKEWKEVTGALPKGEEELAPGAASSPQPPTASQSHDASL